MAVKLANDESVVKSWHYGTIKNGMTQKTEATLIVTNKRVIDVKEGKNLYIINEFPVSYVSGFHFNTSKSSLFRIILAVLEIIIGIPFILLLGLGIKMIRAGIATIKGGEFVLEFKGTHLGTAGMVGMYNGLIQRSANKIKLRFDKAMVREIGEEIGATLLALKQAAKED